MASQALPPGLLWLIVGVVLMALEALAPGAFMVWIGLAAIGAGLATILAQLDFSAEVVVFAVLALAAIAAALRLRRRRRGPATLNSPASGLVGRTAHALSVEGQEGRVRMGDSDWQARLAAGAAWPERTAPLEVVGVEGCVLVVRPRAVQ